MVGSRGAGAQRPFGGRRVHSFEETFGTILGVSSKEQPLVCFGSRFGEEAQVGG
jgi:hypothetical protein